MDKWMKGRRVFHKTLNLRIQKGADYQLVKYIKLIFKKCSFIRLGVYISYAKFILYLSN